MVLIDANLIIRFLTEDDNIKATAVGKLLSHSKEPLLLTDVTLAEIVWVLTSYYEIPKENVCDKLQSLLMLENIQANKELLLQALALYQNHNISFIDAYLASYALTEKINKIYSFDRDFDKIKKIKRLEP